MTNSPIKPAWHVLKIEEAITALDSNPAIGLEAWQVSDRQGLYGRNELTAKVGRSRLSILIDQFTNVMLLMLMAVAFVSAILDLQAGEFPKDAVAIAAIVILNGILGYVQESRAEAAIAALKRMAAPNVRIFWMARYRKFLRWKWWWGILCLLKRGYRWLPMGV
jgi:Ca2+-transporting ATPase